MEHAKIQRLLRMLMLLNGKRRYTLREITERMEISDSTAYRYLDTIEEAGFALNRKNGCYNLVAGNHTKNLNNLLHFSEEEVYILYKTLSLLEGSTPVMVRLIGKLNALYDMRALSQRKESRMEEAINLLREANNKKIQVKLHNYRSNNSDSVGDRVVEPFSFLSDYTGIWCYDVQNHTCKQFKVARTGEVELLPTHWQYENSHAIPFTDAFRMSSEKPVAQITATLSLKAFNLLTEEYPLTEKYIQPVIPGYRLHIPVAGFQGVGRFVLGMPGEVDVSGPEAFIQFLREKIIGYTFVS